MSSNKTGFLLLCTSLAACADQAVDLSSGTIIENVGVVDVVDGHVEHGMTVAVQGERIVAVARTSAVVASDEVTRIDGSGKYVVPGLWDMHAHVAPPLEQHFLPLFVANGVTGVRDMAGSVDAAREVVRAFESDSLAAPRIVAGGGVVDGAPPAMPWTLSVSSPEAGRRVVDSLAGAGASFIKLYSFLEPDVYRAMVERAGELGLPAVGHVPFAVNAADASALGHASIEHLTGVVDGCSRAKAEVRADRRAWRAARAAGDSSVPNPSFNPDLHRRILAGFDRALCLELMDRLANRRTWLVPTLSVLRVVAFASEPSITADPRMEYVSAFMKEHWADIVQDSWRAGTEADRRVAMSYYEMEVEIVGLAADRGVPILAGTDTPNPYVVQGFSLHDELALLVQAGLTPGRALRAATYDPAVFLGLEDSLGTVEPGKLADLVLLDADPLADIANTRRISAVVHNGRIYDRARLDDLLSRVKRASGGTE